MASRSSWASGRFRTGDACGLDYILSVSYYAIEDRREKLDKRLVVRLDSKVFIIRSQKGLIFCGWNIGSSFKKGRKKRITHGTISSRRPERNRIGTSVIDGRKVSDGQT